MERAMIDHGGAHRRHASIQLSNHNCVGGGGGRSSSALQSWDRGLIVVGQTRS